MATKKSTKKTEATPTPAPLDVLAVDVSKLTIRDCDYTLVAVLPHPNVQYKGSIPEVIVVFVDNDGNVDSYCCGRDGRYLYSKTHDLDLVLKPSAVWFVKTLKELVDEGWTFFKHRFIHPDGNEFVPECADVTNHMGKIVTDSQRQKMLDDASGCESWFVKRKV